MGDGLKCMTCGEPWCDCQLDMFGGAAADSSWHSYSKIYALGHRATRDLMDGDVLIEEKVDGSQFSFGIFGVED